MKVALFANAQKLQAHEILKDIAHFLRSHGVEVAIEHNDCFSEDELPAITSSISSCDFLACIGGDGSILHLLHKIGIPDIPIVGINLGSLGFLADVTVTNLFSELELICQNSYHVTERLVIEGHKNNQKQGFAVNEITIHRGCCPNLVDLTVHVDGVFLNTFSADGLIISTPSGSTAYSLSAGGPILTPDLQALVLTPICPHSMSHRPIVLMPKESISIELWQGAKSVDIAFDGQTPTHLSQGESIEIRKSPDHFRLITMPTSDFFNTLRTKLGWTGSLRSQR